MRVTGFYWIGSASHFVVRFLVDECVGSVPAKRILSPLSSSLSVGDRCKVKWTDGQYEAIVLAKGMPVPCLV